VATRKRTIVRVETRSLSVIRPVRAAVNFWCGQCAAVVPTVTPEHAARISGSTPREVYRLIESGRLHFTETTDGQLLVCCESLPKGKRG
jgi:hypothetical protein